MAHNLKFVNPQTLKFKIMKNLIKLSFLFLAMTFVNQSFAQDIKKETKKVEKPVKKTNHSNKKAKSASMHKAVEKKNVMVKEEKIKYEKM